MSIAKIGKLQENTAALCKISCETLRVSAVGGSEYVWSWKLKRPLLPSGYVCRNSGCDISRGKWRQPGVMWRQSGVWKPSVMWRQPGGMWRQPGGIPSQVECAGSHTPCILDLLMDSKELSSISDCFGDQKAIKTPKLNTIWLELITRVLNMLIGLKGDNYYSKVFKRVNYKLWNSTFWVVINMFGYSHSSTSGVF